MAGGKNILLAGMCSYFDSCCKRFYVPLKNTRPEKNSNTISFGVLLFIFTTCFIPSAFSDIEVKPHGGVSFAEQPGPSYAFKIGGLLHLDNTWFSGSTQDKQGQFPNGAIIRRCFLDFGGTIAKDWSFNFNTSIQPVRPNGNITAILREFLLNYAGFENSNLQFGHIGIPSSLENWGYNSDLFFIDTSLPIGSFFPNNDFGLGIYADRTFLDTFTLAGALYQPRHELTLSGQVGLGRSDRLNEALRLTFSPIHTKTCVLHFGAWVRNEACTYTFVGNAIPLAFAYDGYDDVPEAQARNTANLVDTGSLRSKSNLLSGIEVAGIWGPMMIQAEYMGSRVRQMYSNTNPAVFLNNRLWFDGWFVQGSYIFTGESHRYDFPLGLFRRPNPDHCYGAWEIVARYSSVNLTSKNVFGGIEHNISIGLNWYITDILRLCSNYIHASAHPTLSAADGANNTHKRKLDIFALRIQIAF